MSLFYPMACDHGYHGWYYRLARHFGIRGWYFVKEIELSYSDPILAEFHREHAIFTNSVIWIRYNRLSSLVVR